MAHFSKISGSIVVEVIVAEQEEINKRIDSSSWIQTSFNTHANVHLDPITHEPDGGIALRGNYGSVGSYYDQANDVFIDPKPYPSWTLSTSSWLWSAPIDPPDYLKEYTWDEDNQVWNASSTSSADFPSER